MIEWSLLEDGDTTGGRRMYSPKCCLTPDYSWSDKLGFKQYDSSTELPAIFSADVVIQKTITKGKACLFIKKPWLFCYPLSPTKEYLDNQASSILR